MNTSNVLNGCQCGQLGDDCPGAGCAHHRDNPKRLADDAHRAHCAGFHCSRCEPEQRDAGHAPVQPCSVRPTSQQHALRTLRRWHWEQMTQNRALAGRAASGAMAGAYNETADRHLSFVQTLNAYFPQGDTAERDAMRVGA